MLAIKVLLLGGAVYPVSSLLIHVIEARKPPKEIIFITCPSQQHLLRLQAALSKFQFCGVIPGGNGLCLFLQAEEPQFKQGNKDERGNNNDTESGIQLLPFEWIFLLKGDAVSKGTRQGNKAPLDAYVKTSRSEPAPGLLATFMGIVVFDEPRGEGN